MSPRRSSQCTCTLLVMGCKWRRASTPDTAAAISPKKKGAMSMGGCVWGGHTQTTVAASIWKQIREGRPQLKPHPYTPPAQSRLPLHSLFGIANLPVFLPQVSCLIRSAAPARRQSEAVIRCDFTFISSHCVDAPPRPRKSREIAQMYDSLLCFVFNGNIWILGILFVSNTCLCVCEGAR